MASTALALVVPRAGRPWLQHATVDELAEQLGLVGSDWPDMVRQARHVGTEIHVALTHAELARWWSVAGEHGLQVEASQVLEKLKIHVPEIWRASELGHAIGQRVMEIYSSGRVPAFQVDIDYGKISAAIGPWTFVADEMRAATVKAVSAREVASALRMLTDPPGWLAEWNRPERVWLAASVHTGHMRRTVYLPALEPIDIDPRGTLRAVAPAQFVIALQTATGGIPIFGPYTTVQSAEAHVDRAQEACRQLGWPGVVAPISAIQPGRLTMYGQIARYLRRAESVA